MEIPGGGFDKRVGADGAIDIMVSPVTEGKLSMALQNRVDPAGAIHHHAARGLLTGNRGIIHDPQTRTLLTRRWSTKAWIACRLVHPRGRLRDVMGRNGAAGGAGWTELFFLDEVTALAAGHRPCFYCRREAAIAFLACFATGNGTGPLRAGDVDAILHGQRQAAAPAGNRAALMEAGDLPDGAIFARDGAFHVLRRGRTWRWSFEGYAPSQPPDPSGAVEPVTPPSVMAALRAGYAPLWHPSAA